MENYRGLYKAQSKTGVSRNTKRENAIREQKKKREDVFLGRRKIELQESVSPAAKTPAVDDRKKETRREKFLRWKAAKESLIAQQKLKEKKKPPFKVGVFHPAINPISKLETVHATATAIKCTTAKKAAAESRLNTATNRKAKPPTSAAVSLAALSAPAEPNIAAFSGRVTRSRTAAASSAKGVLSSKTDTDKKAKKTAPSAPKVRNTAPSASKGASTSSTGRVAANKSVKEKVVNQKNQTSTKKGLIDKSFAPDGHKFKAPASLTFPTTPLTLKRKAGRAFEEFDLPQISGISVLSNTPSGLSPKIQKTDGFQRRKRLSKVVKDQTPKKVIPAPAESLSSSEPHTTAPSVNRCSSRRSAKLEQLSESSKPSHQEAVEEELRVEVSETSDAEQGPPSSVKSKTPRKSLRGKKTADNSPETETVTSVQSVQRPSVQSVQRPRLRKSSKCAVVNHIDEPSPEEVLAEELSGKIMVSETFSGAEPGLPSSVKTKTPRKSLRGKETKNAEGSLVHDNKVSTPSVKKTRKKSLKAEQVSSTQDISVSMPVSRHRRSQGAFTVTNLSNILVPESKTTTDLKPADITDGIILESSHTNNPSSSIKRESVKEKENVPVEMNESIVTEDLTSIDKDGFMDPIIVGSRRMSIHEPSPVVHVSPESLASGMVPAQFSPFITSARGKDKYSTNKRRSSLIPYVPDIPPEELARSKQTEHFRNLLEKESSRLLTLSSVWEGRKSEAPPAMEDKILGPIGQARLLVNDKFQQFRKLVDKFEQGDTDGKITADDLTGFWEMVLLTVDNIDKRFKELEDLRENNWEEIVTLPKKAVSHVNAAPKPIKSQTNVQSRLKSIIEAARKRKQERRQNKLISDSKNASSFDGGFFKIDSPKKSLPSPKPSVSSPIPAKSIGSMRVMPSTPLHHYQRRSLLQKVLTNSAVRAQQSPANIHLNRSLPASPSPKVALAQMRASELGKRMSMDSQDNSFSENASSPVLKSEPMKSILKSARKSSRINTPRNRVAFEGLRRSSIPSPSSLGMNSSPTTPTNCKPISERVATPGSRKRSSLIPRPISSPKTDRVSLLPMRESLAPSKPLPSGDLMEFSTP